MIASFDGRQHTMEVNLQERICSMVSRHPLNLADIADSLGMDQDQATEVHLLFGRSGKN